MDKLIDMHMHSCYSDGELTPMELVKLAINKNIGVISITDHDTINGIKSINKSDSLIVNSGIKIVDGIEFSIKASHGTFHVLGYNIDLNNECLNKRLSQLKDSSINYIFSVMEQIKRDYGIFFTYDDIKNLANSNRKLGRPELAKLCVKNGYAVNVQDAFDKYLNAANEKVRFLSKSLTYEECLDLISGCGGISILAHPKSLDLSDKEFLILLKNMISCGLGGIEVYHSSHSFDEMNYYLDISNKYNLLVSGGSDYHGKTVKPNVELGTGVNNNLKIKKLSLLDKVL